MRGSTLDVRIWRLKTSDSDVYKRQILLPDLYDILIMLSTNTVQAAILPCKAKKTVNAYINGTQLLPLIFAQ